MPQREGLEEAVTQSAFRLRCAPGEDRNVRGQFSRDRIFPLAVYAGKLL